MMQRYELLSYVVPLIPENLMKTFEYNYQDKTNKHQVSGYKHRSCLILLILHFACVYGTFG